MKTVVIDPKENTFVLGYGMVGKATAHALNIPYYFSRKTNNITLQEGAKKKFCFVCLPTETDEKGEQGEAIKVILDYITQIHGYKGSKTIFIIRSTVIPGTCRYLSEKTKATIIMNPEFLSEMTADFDAMHPKMIVLGGEDLKALEAVRDLYKEIKSKIRITTTWETAEMLKYTFNIFGAVKVVFANQIYDMCEKTKADYKKIQKALHFHPWGSKHHFKVIHKNGRGAGGRCIPKDLKVFAKWSNSSFFEKVQEVNNTYLSESKKT